MDKCQYNNCDVQLEVNYGTKTCLLHISSSCENCKLYEWNRINRCCKLYYICHRCLQTNNKCKDCENT